MTTCILGWREYDHIFLMQVAGDLKVPIIETVHLLKTSYHPLGQTVDRRTRTNS
jgi:hypothetical protein